eukprot:9085626-Pyramimonas_sp.AAC.1
MENLRATQGKLHNNPGTPSPSPTKRVPSSAPRLYGGVFCMQVLLLKWHSSGITWATAIPAGLDPSRLGCRPGAVLRIEDSSGVPCEASSKLQNM